MRIKAENLTEEHYGKFVDLREVEDVEVEGEPGGGVLTDVLRPDGVTVVLLWEAGLPCRLPAETVVTLRNAAPEPDVDEGATPLD